MIELVNITKKYDTVAAVNRVSLTIADHARLAILGPSGSGKTTILRLIAGLEIPTEGTITIDGKVVSTPDSLVMPSERSVGFVFQTPALWPHMNVERNILFALQEQSPDEARKRLDELLGQMAIKDLRYRFPYQLSGGEARRVSLARALAPNPSLLLFDEPLIHLDEELKTDILTLIADNVKASASSMIYVTHDKREAEAIADTTVRLKNGQVVPS